MVEARGGLLGEARTALVRAEYGGLEALPDAARALFGGDFFSTEAWYRTTLAAALPPGARAVFVTLSDGVVATKRRPRGTSAGDAASPTQAWRVLAVFPMLVTDAGVSALTTPYTCLWRPLLAPGLSPLVKAAVWSGFASWCRQFASVRLDALDSAGAAAIAAGVAGSGLVPLRFDHFGNWHIAATHGWGSYLARRAGYVRETIRRRGKKLRDDGAVFSVVSGMDGLEAAVAAYEEVYAKSWKMREPFPAFNATLIRACAQDGSLRLGLLTGPQGVLAAQFWVVRGKWAAVLKLAHDEAARALSPGTVLTAMMIERLLGQDKVTELDFGRGDDAYKESWTSTRRQRVGLVLANPWRVGGLGLIARQFGGAVARRWTAYRLRGWTVPPGPAPR